MTVSNTGGAGRLVSDCRRVTGTARRDRAVGGTPVCRRAGGTRAAGDARPQRQGRRRRGRTDGRVPFAQQARGSPPCSVMTVLAAVYTVGRGAVFIPGRFTAQHSWELWSTCTARGSEKLRSFMAIPIVRRQCLIVRGNKIEYQIKSNDRFHLPVNSGSGNRA